MGKQNRLLTWNPLLLKANKSKEATTVCHTDDGDYVSCNICISFLTAPPATYAFIFHYEIPLCNKFVLTVCLTSGNTFPMVCQVCMCSLDARKLLKCTLSEAFYRHYLARGRLRESRIKLATQASDLLMTVQQLCHLSHNSLLPFASGPVVPTLWNMWSHFFSWNVYLHTMDLHKWKSSKLVSDGWQKTKYIQPNSRKLHLHCPAEPKRS